MRPAFSNASAFVGRPRLRLGGGSVDAGWAYRVGAEDGGSFGLISRPPPLGAPAEYEPASYEKPLFCPRLTGPDNGVGVAGVPNCKDLRKSSNAYRLELSERPKRLYISTAETFPSTKLPGHATRCSLLRPGVAYPVAVVSLPNEAGRCLGFEALQTRHAQVDLRF